MLKITQAVILAGGAGTRLRPFTLKDPKPMISVNDKPFLEHLIDLLSKNLIKEVVILTGYREDKIRDYFGDGSKFGINIKYSFTPLLNEKGEENQSGLRIKNAQNLLNDVFLLLYCDNYWPLRLEKLVQFFTKHPAEVLTTVYSNLDNSTKNNVLVAGDGYVSKYDPSRKGKKLNGVDIGFFLIRKRVLDFLPKTNSKFELFVLPKLIKQRQVCGYLTDQKYYSISDFERVKITRKFLSPKKIVFLDRDGVINKKPPKADYVKSWDEFIFLPGALEAIKLLTAKGYKIFLISNQPGIARGLMSTKNLELIHRKMTKEIEKRKGEINGIYICPHGWNEGCDCRKPKPGLLLKASRDHSIDLTKSIFIGDDGRDKEAGEAAGCKTILVNRKRNLLQIVNSIL